MKVLLHICCGVCAGGSVERLQAEGHEVKGYYYNPNIYPEVEYLKRLDAARRVADRMDFELVEGPFDAENWQRLTEDLKQEPEGGRRCDVCFRFRLEETVRYLPESGCDAATTTLTISPHKPSSVIASIGKDLAGDSWYDIDFKKKDGFNRANILSREFGIYRQDYCGCRYSLRD